MPTPITSPTISSGALTTAYTSATDAAFVGQVTVAMSMAAAMVLAEDPTAYPDDASRKKLANLVNASTFSYAGPSFCYQVVADLITTSSSSDTDIVARVLAIWSTLALQYPA